MSSSKYGDLIREARKQENQEGRIPDSQEPPTGIPQVRNQTDPQVSAKPENQIASQIVNQKTKKQDNQKLIQPPEPEVNLCVKVPKSLRQHWAAEAKREGITMTAVIVEALKAKFGIPD
jgi:hypothetical protein